MAKRLTQEEFVNRAVQAHSNKYDYSCVNYLNIKTPVSIICFQHGVFQQTPDNHLAGKGCPFCAGNVCLQTSDFVQNAMSVHDSFYDYSKVLYISNKIPVVIVCPDHGEFSQRPDSHLSGSGCPICSRIKQVKSRDVLPKW